MPILILNDTKEYNRALPIIVFQSMRFFCGIDGGATKTSCLIADENGQITGLSYSKSSSISIVDVKTMLNNVKEALDMAVKATGISIEQIDTIFIATAGGGSERRRRLISQSLRRMGISNKLYVDSDAIAALMATTLGKPGVVVISGTGSIVLGLDEDGVYHRVGGWGYLIDDEGGAFYIGREALRYAFMAYDGRGEATDLVEHILRHFNVESLMDVVDLISLRRIGVVEIASLAPLVLKLWKNGDRIASNIIRKSCLELIHATSTVISRMKMERPLVGVRGGVFEGDADFTRLFFRVLKRRMPCIRRSKSRFKSVFGALLLAYRSAGRPLNRRLIRNLFESASRGDYVRGVVFLHG
ncbi:MAG: BadF/BadG/BcrA/BcrD ATPase family protein [Candidatus Bathyarchaeia archaeon]